MADDNALPNSAHGKSVLKERLQKRRTTANYVPVHPNAAAPPNTSLVDEPFWNDLPDILQAQILVAINYGKPKKGQPAQAAEKLLWAGAPYLRTSTIISLFFIWMTLLILPVFVLVELVEHGGWYALAWSFVSVFIFVPRVSRSSRVAFALTTQRAFVSTRTMFCSITTDQVRYENVSSAKLKINKDQTGTVELSFHKGPFEPMGVVRMDRIRDLRNACRVLDELLPAEILAAAQGFGGGGGGEMTQPIRPATEGDSSSASPPKKTYAA